MKDLDIKDVDIHGLIELYNQYGIDELNLEDQGLTIEIKKELPKKLRPSVQTMPYGMPMPVQPSASTKVSNKPAQSTEAPPVEENDSSLKIVSPITGTFYHAPSPTADPFVREGSIVTPDTTVCIIEAMKIMNEIKADVSGKITKIVAKNENPVQPGAILFLVEPS